ncbi:MAG: YciI family protein [Polyangiaceae bacterium]
MKYLLMIYENEKRWENGYDKNELAEYGAFGKEFAGAIQGGHALKPTRTATTVRVRDGKRLTTDGPFTESKEQLGGYYLIEAKDLDEAVTVAGKIPAARFGGIEIRPIMTFS